MDDEKILSKLEKNLIIRKGLSGFRGTLKDSIWIVLGKIPQTYAELKITNIEEYLSKTTSDKKQRKAELAKILKHLKKTDRNSSFEQFHYSDKRCGVSYPIVLDSETIGYVILFGLKKSISVDLETLLIAFTNAVVQESVKEVELENINKTVRPRAIALSTVHTVHRLMTSTLDLNELLPRIARLSLQVIRANRCSIKLVDKKRKTLIPKTTIDLRKAKTKLKKIEIGKYAPGRSVKKGTPIRSEKYLAVPMIDEDVVGVITLYDKVDSHGFTQFDEEIMKTLCEQAAIAIKNAQLFKEQTDLTLSSIKCIAQLLQNRPHGVHRAEASFIKLISIIGIKFKMNESEINMLKYAAMLHDAGQISIPEKVLMKRGELTGDEYDIMKTHTIKGAALLSKFKPLKPIVPIILYHHENFNGTGYPKGLKGSDIPLAARILAIVACFEAMIIDKPYRKALSIPAAIKEIKRGSGNQYDPEIVKVFCESVDRKDVKRMLEKELGRS